MSVTKLLQFLDTNFISKRQINSDTVYVYYMIVSNSEIIYLPEKIQFDQNAELLYFTSISERFAYFSKISNLSNNEFTSLY